jgi:hypothetical protein
MELSSHYRHGPIVQPELPVLCIEATHSHHS